VSVAVRTWLQRTAFVAALAVVGGATFLLEFERSGALRARAQSTLERELGLALDIEDVELDWFGPGVTLRGVTLHDAAAAFTLREVTVALEFSGASLRLARVDVRGGRVELSTELLARWETALAQRETSGVATPESRHVPVLVVEDLRCDWLHPTWGELALGSVDLLFRPSEDGVPRIEGRIEPAFADVDAGPAPQVFLSGERDAEGRVRLVASCEDVPIDSDAIPPLSPAAPARDWQPQARLSLELEARFQLDESAPSSGRLRLRASDGRLVLPTTAVPLDDVDVDVEALCAAPDLTGLLDPASWRSTAHLRARWDEHVASVWALFGANAGEGLSARAWLHAPALPMSRDLARATGLGEELEELWRITDPIGTVDALVGARWPAASSVTDSQAALRPELAADIDLGGTVSLCYSGVPNSRGEREGFPLRVDATHGRLLALHDFALSRPSRLGILGVLGAHSGGTRDERPGFADGLVQVPHEPGAMPWLDLRVGGHGLPVDGALERGLLGLSDTDFIFPSFSPAGGLASVVTRLHMQGADAPACHLVVEVEGVQARWSGLPLPAQDVHGRIVFQWDPRRLAATSLDLRARSLNGADIRIRGRLQDLAESGLVPQSIEVLDVDVTNIGLRGADRTAIAASLTEVDLVLASMQATGHADVSFAMSEAGPNGGLRRWRASVEPRASAEVQPEVFRVRINSLRGRVLLDGDLSLGALGDAAPRRGTRGRVAPLVGRWVAGGTVAATAELPAEDDGRIELRAAALDIGHPALAGALTEAQSGGIGGFAGPGLASLNVTGRVDFAGQFVLPSQAPRALESNYRVFLRENDVRTAAELGRLDLSNLDGVLEQSGDGSLFGSELRARLAGTPITLRDASFGERDGRFRVETTLEALRLQIDREHLAPFLDEATVRALVDDLGWSGELDVRGAHLQLDTGADGVGEARLYGNVEARRMRIDLGAPIEIERAQVNIEELVFGPSGLRVSAVVSDLEGAVSDRAIERASLRLGYVAPRLEVIGLSARLENGQLDALPSEGDARPFFALELTPPYRFELAGKLSGVDVGGLLKGVFESDFASRGRLDARLELTGDFERLSDVRGKGELLLQDSVLWSIPVVRDLLANLNVETGAVFERIESKLALAEGRIRMEDLRIASPLLALEGDGVLDLDGRLDFDLEVQYRMLDWLGFVNRVIYWVQSSLVRVAIRGDMARPRVELEGALGRGTDPRRGPRDLPLPAWSPLPQRF
jgi:hypothetical protein